MFKKLVVEVKGVKWHFSPETTLMALPAAWRPKGGKRQSFLNAFCFLASLSF